MNVRAGPEGGQPRRANPLSMEPTSGEPRAKTNGRITLVKTWSRGRRQVRYISFTIKFKPYRSYVYADDFSEGPGHMQVDLIRPAPGFSGKLGGGPNFGAFSKFIGTTGGLPVLTGDFLGIWSAGVNGHNFG